MKERERERGTRIVNDIPLYLLFKKAPVSHVE